MTSDADKNALAALVEIREIATSVIGAYKGLIQAHMLMTLVQIARESELAITGGNYGTDTNISTTRTTRIPSVNR